MKSWTISPEKRRVFSDGCTDLGNWRDEDDVVHVLAQHETESTFIDADGQKITEGYRWWETPCDMRFDELRSGTPVYVDAPVTCVLCLEHA